MFIDLAKCRKLLDALDLDTLFVECLGWERHNATIEVSAYRTTHVLKAVAEKRGFSAFVCGPGQDGRIPDYQSRGLIDRAVTKLAREHVIIFVNGAKTEQLWQWVRRGNDKPVARREYSWHKLQATGMLLERVLPAITFGLDEEARIKLPDVTGRAAAGFDVEKVTKRFFERFQQEHTAFHEFVEGITERTDRDWYASVMLNRLMFCYFIQKKGLLDGDQDYLRNRLTKLQQTKGKDKFWSFYRHFLLRLFHEGLSLKPNQRPRDLDTLIGKIPYLNGGLFLPHDIEERYKADIQIPDKAFERVFRFFDEYRWHLDERELRENNEINPDILGYIFEKYINQKQMGAYYTKEDITGYIAQNTIIPFILDQAAKNCGVAFKPPEGQHAAQSVWRLLKSDPDRYIYAAVRHGVIDVDGAVIRLPAEIEAGLKDVSKRGGWNKPAPEPFALPTESWREHVARRKRCLELRESLRSGGVTAVNDLVTLNLDIRQFAEDVIDNCDGPELLRAIWRAGESVTVLDPTCGSGAFLFAALNVLEPLYEACLDRMGWFLDSLAREAAASAKSRPEKFSDFKNILARVEEHPNRRYFILKSMIVNNLFGVDIMAEACEICKLRLFLKLVAQVEEGAIESIEPLPDIDFNIRAGNTLIGFTSMDAIKRSMSGRLDFARDADRLQTQAETAASAFRLFRELQVGQVADPKSLAEGKRAIRDQLRDLDGELTEYLAAECGVVDDAEKLVSWHDTHRPLHWLVDFYAIVSRGGFDVILGNPPYAGIPRSTDRSLLRRCFKTVLERWSRDEDIYTCVVERSWQLLRKDGGRFGMILALSVAFSTKRPFVVLRQEAARRQGRWWWSHFDRIPSALFGNEVRTRCTISLLESAPSTVQQIHSTTALMRWEAPARASLFPNLTYSSFALDIADGIPKVASQRQADALAKLVSLRQPLGVTLINTIAFAALADMAPHFPGNCVFVGGTAYNWFPAWREIPETTREDGRASLPARTIGFKLPTTDDADVVFALLCSSLGFWWWAVASDGFNLKKWLIDRFPLSPASLSRECRSNLARAGQQLRVALKRQYVYKDNKGRIGNFYLPACQGEVTAIDSILARGVEGFDRQLLDDIREFNAAFSRAEVADEGDGDD